MSAMTRLLWLLPLLAGCAGNPFSGDPMQRPGTWAATGDNDANLHAMIADPHDLQAGAELPAASLGVEAAPAVGRLLTGRLLPLLDEPTSPLGASSSGAGASQGGGNAGAQ